MWCTQEMYICCLWIFGHNGLNPTVSTQHQHPSLQVEGYMITCSKEKCKLAYIGQTERMLKKGIGEHKQYVRDRIIH